MNRILSIVMAALLLVLVAAGSLSAGNSSGESKASPEGAVQAFYDNVKAHNFDAAYALISPSSKVDKADVYRDIAGRDGSLKTYSTLQKAEARTVARNGDQEATVRANLEWSTAVGAFNESQDLKTVREDNGWRIVWPKQKQEALPPQVIPTTYLRWDVIHRGSEDDWGAQDVAAPNVRIVSMNAIEREGRVIVMGEVVNEDTVPGFVNVSATLIGKDGSRFASESSFDKTSHVLLPKEVSPFRIDFPGAKLAQLKGVDMQRNTILVPATADPVIGVLHQQLQKNDAGHTELRGELLNESGQVVNIPHVIATYYDGSGKVIWVSDGYVDKALEPQIPVSFKVGLSDDLVSQVKSYRVTVNHYSRDSQM